MSVPEQEGMAEVTGRYKLDIPLMRFRKQSATRFAFLNVTNRLDCMMGSAYRSAAFGGV